MDTLHRPAEHEADTVRLDSRFFAEQASNALWAFFLPIRMVIRAVSLTSRPLGGQGDDAKSRRHLPAE